MSKFSCQEFCDEFNVWISFDQSGYGQVYSKKPKFIERDNFFLSIDDAKLLPCLVNDYYEWSNKRKVILFSPNEKVEINDKLGTIIPCDDYKKDDTLNVNVVIKSVISDDNKNVVVCSDGSHDFVWNTKAKNLPNINEKRFLRAKVTGSYASVDLSLPAFEVTGCSFLREKKIK